MSFDPLGLSPELLRAVADQGYTEPTPIQREAIPVVLAGRDLLAGAQTGTGKTAAFVLPILNRLADSPTVVTGPTSRDRREAVRPPIRVLVLVPTRELALQVEQSVRTYGRHRRVRSTTIYGGVGFDPQVRALRAGPAIVVATPGRLLDHVTQRTIDLSHVEVLVLDEADRMLDMGFIRDIRRVVDLVPAQRQTLLFSATFSAEIRRLASGLLVDPATVQATPQNTATELVSQLVHPVDRHRKRELLSHLIRTGRIEQALVFTRTKHGANHLAEQLQRDGIAATAIHGNKSQGQRVKALNDFKAGRASILVATEVASRGLDIDALPHVVNYELPMVAEDYVHRIGRTGRAGATGDAISLVCVDEQGLLNEIQALLRQRIPVEVVPGFEPDRSIRPEPLRQRSQGPRPPRRGVGRPQGGPARRPAPARTAPVGTAAAFPQHAATPQHAAPAGPRPSPRPDPRHRNGPRQDRPFRGQGAHQGPVGIGNGPARPGRPAHSGRPGNPGQQARPGQPARPSHQGQHGRPGQGGHRNGHPVMPGERLREANRPR